MSDTLTISDAELDAMLSHELPCVICKAPATLMSRGHCCRPPGFRVFKCERCYIAWSVAAELKLISEGFAFHRTCGQPVYSVDELGRYVPV